MIGLTYLAAGLLYLLVSIWFVHLAVNSARRRGKAGWKWGLAVGLAMYLLVFWDWIPTVVAHKYYCARYSGFTQYKSLDEWKRENPGVSETLEVSSETDSIQVNGHIQYRLNKRFIWDISRKNILFGLKINKKIIDEKTLDVLAQHVDFSTNIKPIELGARSVRDYKVWLKNDSCEYPGRKYKLETFNKLKQQIKHMGDDTYGNGKVVPNGSVGGG